MTPRTQRIICRAIPLFFAGAALALMFIWAIAAANGG